MSTAGALHDELARVLHRATRAGQWVPCRAPRLAPLFTSESDDELDTAAGLCADCPVLDACRLAGETEVAGVWGGVVRKLWGRYRVPEPTDSNRAKRRARNPDALVLDLLAAIAPLDSASGHAVARALDRKPSSAPIRRALARAQELGYLTKQTVHPKLHRWTITEHGRARLDRGGGVSFAGTRPQGIPRRECWTPGNETS